MIMRFGFLGSLRCIAFIVLATLVAGTGWAAGRGHGSTKSGLTGKTTASSGGLTVTLASMQGMLDCMVGPGVSLNNAYLVGAPDAFATFTGGTGIIGFDSGVILSTGNALSVVGPNIADDTSTDNGFPGDPILDALVPGYVTHDAASLEFDFACDASTVFSIEYVFASEEYNEYVNSPFNDVFGFFLDGTTPASNIALVPAFCSSPGQAVSVNSVNCNNPFSPPTGMNCDCYTNNDIASGAPLNTEMDGLTHVFARTVPIVPGVHHIKIAIADAGDGIYDSNVFIRCQSLACAASTPTRTRTWGHVKSIYR
jgi:hypothetical protein